MKDTIRATLAFITIILAIACYFGAIGGALYCGLYLGIYKPIMTIAEHLDTNTLTGSILGKQVVFFMLRGVMTFACVVTGLFVGSAFVGLSRRFTHA